MTRVRRHDRRPLMTDIILQTPADDRPPRCAGRVFNVSPGGLAVYSSHPFPVGKLMGLELTVPVPGQGLRAVTLYGVIRWVRPEGEGTLMGVEIMIGDKAGDYLWFRSHLDLCLRAYGRGCASPAGAARSPA
jgi:hypothetical protein